MHGGTVYQVLHFPVPKLRLCHLLAPTAVTESAGTASPPPRGHSVTCTVCEVVKHLLVDESDVLTLSLVAVLL